MNQKITNFLASPSFAVVGASPDRTKYGNKVLRCYMQNQRPVVPVHPSADEVEGLKAVKNLTALGRTDVGVSIITPPPVTLKVVEEAIKLGITRLWMQPGAESDQAITLAEENGIEVIADGPCVLVVLGFRDV